MSNILFSHFYKTVVNFKEYIKSMILIFTEMSTFVFMTKPQSRIQWNSDAACLTHPL